MTSMARQPLPAIAPVVSFIDCINRGDLDGLTELMTDDHALVVLDEAPLVGRARTGKPGRATSRLSRTT
jgi:ketosteroid isomerase-like protein